ncbi:MFS transporter [Streptomyces sp. NPDC101490]|uniref:MFS transporter n=1 Tax=Streptomyces sp. NPDC101490 TaxID=3366143 RepID=UPI0037F7F304
MARRRLGRRFGLLWAAYAVSAYGSGLGFGALPLIAVLVLRAGPAEVSALSAAGPAVGAVVAVPLAPWVEFRRKRPVMIVTDLVRCAALASVPVAYALGILGLGQLLVVSATLSAARIASGAASGAYLKALLRPEDLLVANARFESTNWSSIAVGPPLGGAAIGVLGPVVTLVADALSHLLSALCLVAAGGREEAPPRPPARATEPTGATGTTMPTGTTAPAGALLGGWRHLFHDPVLRALCLNNMAVSGLIMATEPVLAVLLLRDLAFPPWQYALAFAAPCLGGLVGSRLARRTVARHGRRRVIGVVGTLRAVWLIGLALVGPGTVGLLTVMAVELAIIVHMSLYTPVLATLRLERTPRHLVARTLTAWSIAQQASIAVLTALGGLLATATGPRTALLVAGLLALATPLLLPRSDRRSPRSSTPPRATPRSGPRD